MASGRLEGKIALITGSAGGIGSAIVAAFINEGAKVWLSDVEPQTSDDGRTLRLDVTSSDDWSQAKQAIAKRDGRLDILVNNAGVELLKPLQEASLDEWRRVMSINVDSIFLGCKLLEELLIAGSSSPRPASVISMSSIAGLVGLPNQIAYNTSKAAVRHLSKSLAIEWAAHEKPIRANTIHPGCIRTTMLEEAVNMWVENGLLGVDDPWSDLANMTPVKRIGATADVAMGAVYLASDESNFVTGSELVIDGGWTAQ
ncbi:SDR family oxidoreductase [Sphingorhabdus sp. Alg231-15]|uniref:SDR family oxidoreductase n=1 Tax=Sphingorhabdus sp. Alg231-15 TaxID=1922222 RepID=UPI000D557D0E